MPEFVSLQGPVEKIDGKLVLRIPLDAGGGELIECSKGISEVEGDTLKVVIPEWLAEKLGIYEGALVAIDNRGGKFNLCLSDENPKPN
ncbi:MAG: hypothetical protein ACRD5W_08475 [Candidatus Acidiferrales bacterium]